MYESNPPLLDVEYFQNHSVGYKGFFFTDRLTPYWQLTENSAQCEARGKFVSDFREIYQ